MTEETTKQNLRERILGILKERTTVRFEEYTDAEYTSLERDSLFPKLRFISRYEGGLISVASQEDFSAAAVHVGKSRYLDRNFHPRISSSDEGDFHKDLYFLIHLPSKQVHLVFEDSNGFSQHCPHRRMDLKTDGERIELDIFVEYEGCYEKKTFTRKFRPGFQEITEKPGIGKVQYRR
jgi:hypothetical protein